MGRPGEKKETPKVESPSLESIVENSKEHIENAKPKKKGRGRPKGSTSTRKEAPKSEEEIKIEEKRKAAAKDATKQFITPACYLPFHIVSESVGVEEVKLEEDEAELMADSAAEVLMLYAPTMDPRTAAWLGLASVVGSISLKKYAAYKMAVDSRKIAPKIEADESTD